MTTYSSDKAVPYVYICTHKETGQFYIGYRMKNVKLNTPSHLDLPEYKTSSKVVNPDFHDYIWTIVAEFFNPSHAYTFEQQLIYNNWDNPLLLNGHYCLGETQFRNSGPHSEESKKKISNANKGKSPSIESRQKMSDAKKGIHHSEEHKRKISDTMKGVKQGPHSAETKQKMSDTARGRIYKLVTCPHCGKIGGGGAMKQHHFDNCKHRIR